MIEIKKIKVMIFDDDADILEVCAIILEQNGYAVSMQNNCEQILQKLRSFDPDVILMDNKIPPFGGVQATQQIREAAGEAGTPGVPGETGMSGEAGTSGMSGTFGSRRLPVIFFSANRDVAGLASQATADYFLEKPFDLDELVGVVRKAVGGK